MRSFFSNNSRLFLDSRLGPLAFISLVVFIAASIKLAFYVDIDFFDSHNFLLQARRLTDPDYAFLPFDSRRPRTLVMFFTFFNMLSVAFTGGYPSLTAYQLLMVGISTSFIFGWLLILRSLWGARIAYLSTVFLLIPQISIHYAPFLLSDMVAGFGWALMFLTLLWVLKKLEAQGLEKTPKTLALVLGGIGCIAGLTKNHFSLLVFSILFIFYLAYLFLPVFKSRPWGSLKQFRKFFLWVGLFYVIAIELETRIFGYLGEGVWEHFRHLVKQARDQTSEAVVPSLYIENFWLMMGPLFCILAGVSVLFFFIYGLKNWPKSRVVQMGRVCVLLVSLMYLVLTQLIAHKEVRYLIPQLPGLFVVFACGAALIYDKLTHFSRGVSYLWIGLWVVACLHPISRSVADYERFYTSPIYSFEKSHSKGMWTFLKEPTPLGESCYANYACRFDLSERPFELKDDPYYRQHDYEPQFTYFSARPTYIMSCPVRSESKPLIETIMAHFSMGSIEGTQCFILREKSNQPLDRLTILKSIASNVSATGEKELRETYPVQEHTEIECMNLKDQRTCFLKRRFFEPPIKKHVVR